MKHVREINLVLWVIYLKKTATTLASEPQNLHNNYFT